MLINPNLHIKGSLTTLPCLITCDVTSGGIPAPCPLIAYRDTVSIYSLKTKDQK